jgi:predicted N-formylglutamate amidohydrolase
MDVIQPFLAQDEPPPVSVHNADARSPFLLVADHAGRAVPRTLRRLGVATPEWDRHIAWDIGIAGISRMLANTLEATLIQQNYSRLVIDCNRPPGAPTSIPEISELTPIPGIVGLSDADKEARALAIFWPYHERIDAELERRRQTGRQTALIAMHSFCSRARHDRGTSRSSTIAIRNWRTDSSRCLAESAASSSATTSLTLLATRPTTPFRCTVNGAGLPHALVEIRQDLIADDDGQRQWASRLARLLPQAYADVVERQAR